MTQPSPEEAREMLADIDQIARRMRNTTAASSVPGGCAIAAISLRVGTERLWERRPAALRGSPAELGHAVERVFGGQAWRVSVTSTAAGRTRAQGRYRFKGSLKGSYFTKARGGVPPRSHHPRPRPGAACQTVRRASSIVGTCGPGSDAVAIGDLVEARDALEAILVELTGEGNCLDDLREFK
jgi:hypothetical protein